VLVAVLADCALAVIGTGVGLAVITDGEEIHACAHKKSGHLRVVADRGECKRSEEAVSLEPRGSAGTSRNDITPGRSRDNGRSHERGESQLHPGVSAVPERYERHGGKVQSQL
jgi:hypothetical protein